MEVAAHRLLDREPPIFTYERLFRGPEQTPEQKAEMDKLNALIREVNDARNQGRPISIEEAAARRGISAEAAAEVKKLFERADRRYDIELEGGLTGIPVLSPAEVQKMKGELREVALFRFNTGGEAERLFPEISPRVEALRGTSRVSRTVKLLSLPTLPDVLGEIAAREWRDPDNIVLKYTLYLLCLKGQELESTWDYAAEVLRRFWQAILPGKERMHIRRFIRQYSVWCQEFLVRSGLAEEGQDGSPAAVADTSAGAAPADSASPGAPFRMRASAFLKRWLSLGPAASKGKVRR
jgi:hypothetical protein